MLRATKTAAAIVAMAATLTSAATLPRAAASAQKLLVAVPGGQILTYDFDGAKFTLASNYTEPGTAASWMVPNGANDRLYAVNENGNDTRSFDFANKAILAGAKPVVASGAPGVVSLCFNTDKTRLLGGSYTDGSIDVWDSSAKDGTLKLIKTLKTKGPLGPDQKFHRAHDVQLDPTGQFFAVTDLGGDQVVLVDARADKYEILGTPVGTGTKSGPRHGKFIAAGTGKEATHYVVVTELSNELILYSLKYTSAGIEFTLADRQTTLQGGEKPIGPEDAAAGEVQVLDGRDIYASNRRTGLPTGDSIVHFQVGEDGKLAFKQLVHSGGSYPRHFSFSADGSVMFVANQGPAENNPSVDSAVAAFARCTGSGKLSDKPFASLKYEAVAWPDATVATGGPQFVLPV
ncbi:Lactonase, 7-bladed beta-propeller-domain-containing protein [Microdochium bolleyi]|uniref:Lactonase, 7-bladed beta-propeller-domain-containing protein n=1 Tax=Microdochium bolleyi TaxID=196109 RepID=A0A136IUF0_9PEZI|nr:Lactonase, 7-bladed beta-propeller-domain-containing protein [Microdochium bolleyi]